ncbi:unnamed protein product [Urochloa humidicola]
MEPPPLLRAAPPPGLGLFRFNRERRRLPASVPGPVLSFSEHRRGWPSCPSTDPPQIRHRALPTPSPGLRAPPPRTSPTPPALSAAARLRSAPRSQQGTEIQRVGGVLAFI